MSHKSWAPNLLIPGDIFVKKCTYFYLVPALNLALIHTNVKKIRETNLNCSFIL